MVRTKKIDSKAAKLIEAASKGKVSFEFSETKCTEVSVKINDTITFKVMYRDYGIEVAQVEVDMQYGFTRKVDVDGEPAMITKVFDTEQERATWIAINICDTSDLELFEKKVEETSHKQNLDIPF